MRIANGIAACVRRLAVSQASEMALTDSIPGLDRPCWMVGELAHKKQLAIRREIR